MLYKDLPWHARLPKTIGALAELCTEYGAEEPKEQPFWAAQRAALELPNTGFAVTTDIQRALHVRAYASMRSG